MYVCDVSVLPPSAVQVNPFPRTVSRTREHERPARTRAHTAFFTMMFACFVFVHVHVTVSPAATLNVADRAPDSTVVPPSSHERLVNSQPAGGRSSP